MMKFIWDQKYSVNIKTIDDQHKRFFEIINKIHFTLRQPRVESEALKKIIQEFIDYAEFHLVFEEKCFEITGYPDTINHCQIHNNYRQQIALFSLSIQEPTANIPQIAQEIAQFAQDWLSSHILSTDQKYSQYFLAHDIK